MNHPVYTEEQIMTAIEQEGLHVCAYGYKTPRCIYVFVEGQEKDEVWEDLPPSLQGFEPAHWDANILARVNYYFTKQSRPSNERYCDTDTSETLCIPWDEDDEIMCDIVDSALDYLDTECEFFSEPVTVMDMRKWLKEKLRSKFNMIYPNSRWIDKQENK